MMEKEKKLHHKIYVFGNPLVKEDNLALSVAERLEKDFLDVEFVHQDPNEEIKEDNLIILDVAEGIDKVMIIDDINKLDVGKRVSLHDFDIAFSLKLMKKIGLVKKIKIIAIPVNYDIEKACQGVKNYVHLTFKK